MKCQDKHHCERTIRKRGGGGVRVMTCGDGGIVCMIEKVEFEIRTELYDPDQLTIRLGRCLFSPVLEP